MSWLVLKLQQSANTCHLVKNLKGYVSFSMITYHNKRAQVILVTAGRTIPKKINKLIGTVMGDNNHCLLLEDHDYGRRHGLQMWRI